jgi:hypothetical protein
MSWSEQDAEAWKGEEEPEPAVEVREGFPPELPRLWRWYASLWFRLLSGLWRFRPQGLSFVQMGEPPEFPVEEA